MAETFGHYQGMKVAIQGERGSNSHVAALNAFPDQTFDLVSCAQSPEVFEKIADGSVDCAVLPIENTLHGSVFEHYDLLLQYEVQAVGEVLLAVRHNVIAAPGVPFSSIRRVMSHPVALSQCRRWFRAHPEVEAVSVYDTAGSIKMLMENKLENTAGIAPELAAAEYGAEVVVRSIEDHAENYTRFYVLKRGQQTALTRAGNRNKVSLAFWLEHRPGTLMQALGVFEEAGLNLTRIESRPVPGKPWEYVFFADVRYTVEVQMDDALRNLKGVCTDLRVLGHYRAGK